MKPDIKPRSPFVGLIPYSDSDAEFFFGRESETDIISANLRAARLTVLYGSSGVGKSSVLQAGVIHRLRAIAKEDVNTYGLTDFAIVIFRKWAGDPIKDFAKAIHEAIAESLGIDPELLEKVPVTGNLTEMLRAWSQRYNLELLIILDQFEELFNYLTEKDSHGAKFASQFAEMVNASNLSARFLISLRGDTLSLLDFFKESIPGLLENRLQIYHLNAEAAYRAIVEPIRAYNELYKPDPKFEIEPDLVTEIIRQVPARINDNSANQHATTSQEVNPARPPSDHSFAPDYFIETPYLQLVLKKIWNEELRANSHILHLETLTTKLGGADRIIQSHLDDVMETLTPKEQHAASECFEHLVTPMGTKVALTPAALSKLTKFDEEDIKSVLELLMKGRAGTGGNHNGDGEMATGIEADDEARILRTVEIPVGNKRLQGYEVTHDALTLAILNWRTHYIAKHDAANQFKAMVKRYLPTAVIVASFLTLFYGFITYRASEDRYNAELDLLVAKENRNEAEKDKFEADDSLKIAQNEGSEIIKNAENLSKILIDLADPSKEKDASIKKLNELIENDKLPEGYEKSVIDLVAKIDKQKAEDLKAVNQAKLQRLKTGKDLLPRVYFHISDDSQRDYVKSYQAVLTTSNKYTVPGIETVPNLKLKNTQLRYFYKDDAGVAEEAAVLLAAQGLKGLRIVYVSGYEDSQTMRPKHLELWFSNNAFASSDSGEPSVR